MTNFRVLPPIAGFVAAVLLCGPAYAQEKEAGAIIAKTWCAACHLVGPSDTAPVRDTVPTFASIARMPSTTQMSLTVFLSTPHVQMPNFSLTRAEIRNVSAYILSLRGEGGAAPTWIDRAKQ